jgi:hypothetical protein
MGKVTLQSLFNKAYRGLAKQGFKKSVKGNGTCVYRSVNGMKCAIGHLISDKVATAADLRPCSNYSSVRDLLPESITKVLDTLDTSGGDGLRLGDRLQQCHDVCVYEDSPTQMKANLEKFAIVNKLKVPKL